MKKFLLNVIISIFLSFVICHLSFVHAAYTLPYPSYMPGNKLYRVSRMFDALKKYWYFGSIAQVKYHLELSDKYLVEAKTLFEYKQYLLGVDALLRSTKYFQALPFYIKRGQSEGKDMTSFVSIVKEAAAVHSTVFLTMKQTSPEAFQWVPEKASPSDLQLHNELDKAMEAVQSVIKETEQ